MIEQASLLISAGDYAVIHFDGNAPRPEFAKIEAAFQDVPNVRLVKRIRCGWGQWSLVEATLKGLEEAEEAFPDASHFALISGDCLPIKSAAFIHAKLDAEDCDYIEHNAFDEIDWVKVGLREERIIYRHYFNERSQKPLFYGSLKLQQKLGLTRQPPHDLRIMIGSQWFVLRRSTVEALQDFLRARKDVTRFFKTTWIPDEIFFQSVVMHLIPREQVRSRTQTFLLFSDYGMPVNFYRDHIEFLKAQDYFFARKISEYGQGLREEFAALYTDPSSQSPAISSSGASIYEYVRAKGRNGKRAADRFWQRGSTIGRRNELLIVVCKKWHIAGRLRQIIDSDLCSYGYLFDNEADALPPLGNIESSREKRSRHRRAFLRLLFEYHDSHRLLVCLDPSNVDVIRDFASDDCGLRVLEIRTDLDDAFLRGHAERIGLGGAEIGESFLQNVLETLRLEISAESETLENLGLANMSVVSQDQSVGKNTAALMQFLGISDDKAKNIAENEDLFL